MSGKNGQTSSNQVSEVPRLRVTPPSCDQVTPLVGCVKKETLAIAVCVALLVGFLSGIVFSAYRAPGSVGTGVAVAPRPAAPGQRSMPPGNLTEENSGRMLALEQETALNPDNSMAWTQLGNVYFDNGRFAKAIEAYGRSLELAPDNANVLTDLGVMYRRNGQPKEAVAAFDKAMVVDPVHLQSRINKGIVLRMDLNDRDGAIRAWQEALAINPDVTAPNGQPLSEAIKNL